MRMVSTISDMRHPIQSDGGSSIRKKSVPRTVSVPSLERFLKMSKLKIESPLPRYRPRCDSWVPGGGCTYRVSK